MIETYTSATEFRSNIARIANSVAYRQDRCVMRRHGKEIVALVGWEDLEFLRKHRPRKFEEPSPTALSPKAGWKDHFPVPPLPEVEPNDPRLRAFEEEFKDDPWDMTLENVKKYYELLKDESACWLWVARALTVMRVASLRSQSSPHSSG
jgi:hypothetical protein